MRRLAAAVLAAALLAGAGCTADRTPGAAPSSVGGGSPGAAAAPTGGTPSAGTATTTANGREVCAAARKLTNEKVTAFITQLGKALEAAAKGDTKGADAARAAAAKAVSEWATGLRSQATKAEDPQLKALLSEMSQVAQQLTVDLENVDDAKLDELQGRLEQLCGV
ncbi:MAG TPA: hypothetical protein VFR67_15790 [Pilimelia sp.]|nr:hypothetical protein [Pilimelia sp.]